MENKIAAEAPIAVAGITLITVTKVSRYYWSAEAGTISFADKEPAAVVVVSPQAKRAFRITGEEVSLEELTKEATSLKEMLNDLLFDTGGS